MRIIAVSKGEQQHARAIGILENRLTLIPNGLSFKPGRARDEVRQELRLTDNDVVLGFIGRLVDQKNPLLALNAFFKAAEKHPNLYLHVIGDGPLFDKMRQRLVGHQFSSRVFLLGKQPASRFIAGFDAILCSSAYEGMPLLFLEALASGLPLITTRVGGVDEALIDGETGFVVDDHNPETLAAAIDQFMSLRPEQRSQISAGALRHAENFSPLRMGENTRKLYQELLAQAA